MKKTFLLVVSLFILLVSCSLFKDESPREDIIGEWKLVEYYSYWSGESRTINSNDDQVQIKFNSDSVFTQFRNDTLEVIATFSQFENEYGLFINYDFYKGNLFSRREQIEFVSKDLIKVIPQCNDCPNFTFKRTKN